MVTVNIYDIRSYVKIYSGFLSEDLCGRTLSKLTEVNWERHAYYRSSDGQHISYGNDLSVSGQTIPEKLIVDLQIKDLIKRYISEVGTECWDDFDNFSSIRFNKYEVGTEMRTHCDHIKSLFTGKDRGVPILTVLGGLNDDYEGGELVLWQDQVIPLKAGSVMVFPSNFMYPHKVNPVSKGARYSYVSWVW